MTPEVVGRTVPDILLQNRIILNHNLLRSHLRSVVAYLDQRSLIFSFLNPRAAELIYGHTELMGQVGAAGHDISLLVHERRHFVARSPFIRELVGREHIDDMVILMLYGIADHVVALGIAAEMVSLGSAPVDHAEFIPERTAHMLIDDADFLLGKWNLVHPASEILEETAQQLPIAEVGRQNHHARPLPIRLEERFRIRDRTYLAVHKSLDPSPAASEPHGLGENLPDMDIILLGDSAQLPVFHLRETSGEIGHHNVPSVMDYVTGNKGEKPAPEIMELQWQSLDRQI